MLATITIQPHVKNRLTPDTLLPLPWDNEATSHTQRKPPTCHQSVKTRRVSGLLA